MNSNNNNQQVNQQMINNQGNVETNVPKTNNGNQPQGNSILNTVNFSQDKKPVFPVSDFDQLIVAEDDTTLNKTLDDTTISKFNSFNLNGSNSIRLHLQESLTPAKESVFNSFKSALKTFGEKSILSPKNNHVSKNAQNGQGGHNNQNGQNRSKWSTLYTRLESHNAKDLNSEQLADYLALTFRILDVAETLIYNKQVPVSIRDQYDNYLAGLNEQFDPNLIKFCEDNEKNQVIARLTGQLETNDNSNDDMIERLNAIAAVEQDIEIKQNSLENKENDLCNKEASLEAREAELLSNQSKIKYEKAELVRMRLDHAKNRITTPEEPSFYKKSKMEWVNNDLIQDINDVDYQNGDRINVPSPTPRKKSYQPNEVIGYMQQPNMVPQIQPRSYKIDQNTPVFGKDKITIDKWLFQFENACVTSGIPVTMWTRFAINYTVHLAREMTERNIRENQPWELYKKEMIDSFTDVNQQQKLKMQLLSLKQTDSYTKFAEQFQYLTTLLRTNEDDKLTMFLEGLSAETRRLLSIVKPKTFVEAHTWAAKLSISDTARHANLAQTQKATIICHYCRKRGHVERDCHEKQKNLQVSKNLIKSSNSNTNTPTKTNQLPFKKPMPFKKNSITNKNNKFVDRNKSSKDAICYRCNRKGHKADKCFVRLGNLAEIVEESRSVETTQENLDRIYSENIAEIVRPEIFNEYQKGKLEVSNMVHHSVSQKHNYDLIKVPGTIEGTQVVYALDSGATCSIINLSLVKRYQWPLKESDIKIKTADGSIKKVDGTVGPLEVKIGELPILLELMVLPQDCEWDILLGLDYLKPSKSAIFFDEEIFMLGDGSMVKAIPNKLALSNNEANTASVTVEEEEFFSTYDWRDEFTGFSDPDEFKKFFFKHGKFMPKQIYSREEHEFMNKYVNLNKLVTLIKNKDSDGKARIWQKPIDVPEKNLNNFFKLLAEFDDLFANSLEDLEKCTLDKFRIIVEDSRPIYKHPYRRSPKENEIIKKEIDDLLKNGFIRKSRSP